MALIIVLLCIVLLILLVSWAKVNPFLAFLLVSVAAAMVLGIPLDKVTGSVQKGLGDTMAPIVVIICLGAMLGKLIAVSGAAQKIADVLINISGQKHVQWALLLTGFIVGIPLFYGIGFVLVVPLIFSIVFKYKLPAVYIGLPMIAALSVTHGFLPPHPSPVAIAAQFHAGIGTVLIYGLIIAIPTIIVAGPVYASTLKGIVSKPLETFRPADIAREDLPNGFTSFFTALLPVVLLMLAAGLHALMPKNIWVAFLGDAAIVMLISLIFGTISLGMSRGKRMGELSAIYVDALKDIAPILLIIAGSGAFKQVLVDSGVSKQIADQIQTLHMQPLILAWMIAAVIRISLGSSTVAGLTTAGIMAPMIAQNHANPNLMVLAIGAGSLVCSHVNDSGFWLFKEYFNLSIKDTFRSWTVMETLIAVMGLIGVLTLNAIV